MKGTERRLPKCSVCDCRSYVTARGLCSKHYEWSLRDRKRTHARQPTCEQCGKCFDRKGARGPIPACCYTCHPQRKGESGRHCLECGRLLRDYFPSNKYLSPKKYCSRQCRPRALKKEIRRCTQCGSSYVPLHKKQRFCSGKCSGKFNGVLLVKERPLSMCPCCGKNFVKRKPDYRQINVYCSRVCYFVAMKYQLEPLTDIHKTHPSFKDLVKSRQQIIEAWTIVSAVSKKQASIRETKGVIL